MSYFKKCAKKMLVGLALVSAYAGASAAETGSFNKNITFKSLSRAISFYVPTDTTAGKKFELMVCLHGLGDNSVNFRNGLIGSLLWNTLLPNTIFAFPDGGSDANKDFFSPAGDEEIIRATIDYVKANYLIDTNNIILEGFSLGGRSALKYGLDHPTQFKGLLLNTPALQGVNDINNVPGIGLDINYKNADKIAIAMTVGTADAAYAKFDPQVYDKLIANNGKAMMIIVPNMPHTIPDSGTSKKCFAFIKNPTLIANKAELHGLTTPLRTCSPTAIAKCFLRNTGSEKITSCDIYYELNGAGKTYTWTGDLTSFGNAEITLPELTLKEGLNNIRSMIVKLNGTIDYKDSVNNSSEFDFEMVGATKTSLPYNEGFEGADIPNGWIPVESGSLFSWMLDNTIAKSGKQSIIMFNTILAFNNMGLREEFIMPAFDLTKLSKPALSFDIAYNYQKYTPPYFTQDVILADTLEIFATSDCGVTYQSIFKKGGTELATFKDPITNPLKIEDCLIVPSSSDWKNEVINLATYTEFTNISFKISYKSAMGGFISLDNFKVDTLSSTGIEEIASDGKSSIYPNPSRGHASLKIETSNPADISAKIVDVMGREVSAIDCSGLVSGNNTLDLNTENLAPGVYFIRITEKGTLRSEKMIVE